MVEFFFMDGSSDVTPGGYKKKLQQIGYVKCTINIVYAGKAFKKLENEIGNTMKDFLPFVRV